MIAPNYYLLASSTSGAPAAVSRRASKLCCWASDSCANVCRCVVSLMSNACALSIGLRVAAAAKDESWRSASSSLATPHASSPSSRSPRSAPPVSTARRVLTSSASEAPFSASSSSPS
eukprot:scaffold103135_cov69-Phaeocystis_antarctica.AAC.6